MYLVINFRAIKLPGQFIIQHGSMDPGKCEKASAS